MDADSVVDTGPEVTQQSDNIGEEAAESTFDMESATESIADDLFHRGEKEEVEEDIEEEDEPEEIKAEKEPEEEVEKKAAPASWKKDMHETWDKLDPAAQEYIETRESQMKEGLETDRNDANLGRTMRDTMAPFHEFLQKKGMDEPTAVKNLMNIHYQMDNAPDEHKIQLLHQLASSYGLKLDGEQQEIDPNIKSLQDEMQGMRTILNERNQADLQVARERVVNEVEAFASDPKHPYFEEIEGDVATFITAAGMSLEDAYEKAVWANPITRQKEMNRINEEKGATQLEEARKKAEAAKKAKAANVKSRDTKYSPTEKSGTMEDTMKDVMKEIRSR